MGTNPAGSQALSNPLTINLLDMERSEKYGRTLHAPISRGRTSDDRTMAPGYLAAFAQLPEVVLTEKLDGQNNCFSRHGLFARSHAAPSEHPWDKPLRERWAIVRHDLGELEIFGENLYGIHSIEYTRLDSFFYVFGVRERGRWLSWEEVKWYAALLDFPTVPEIPVRVPLAACLEQGQGEDRQLEAWLKANLGMPWEESVQGPGLLGGRNPHSGMPCSEGFVVRDAAGFGAGDGLVPVAPNEFGHLFKLVRPSHVQTDVHWSRTWQPARLVDCARYHWYGYDRP
jgi:hypothetical protein